MDPLFIAGHPAVDFLNTSLAPDGKQTELIGDGETLFSWLVAAELMTTAQAQDLQRKLGAKGADTAAAQARKLREWSRDWLKRWRAMPTRNYATELALLNRWLASEAYCREVIRGQSGLELIVQTQIDSLDELLAMLAAQIADLVTSEDPALLKVCAGPACTLWFVDRTKAHRRLFCSPSTCGNRAKVAAFRERQRE